MGVTLRWRRGSRCGRTGRAWPSRAAPAVTGADGIEGHLIAELEGGGGRLRARHPGEAHAFFLPISVANIVSYIHRRDMIDYWDPQLRLVAGYVDGLAAKYPFWNRSRGADHFFVSCHEWGAAAASRRAVEAISAGCVPVFVAAGGDSYSPPFSDVLDWRRFSVAVPADRVGDIKDILAGISDHHYAMLHRRVLRVRRHFRLNRPAKRFDVVNMVIHSIWLRRLNLTLPY
uniref:Exostosin GT47 domain-containing protein n=1 Tax=Oryza brachyantha TaxID=4533 RepID=J3MGW7_ORYBR